MCRRRVAHIGFSNNIIVFIIINHNAYLILKKLILEQIVAGAHDRFLESGHQKRNIKTMEHHEDHNNPQFDNDVALITVTEPFDFSDPHVQPIEMLMNNTDIPAETICNSTGK